MQEAFRIDISQCDETLAKFKSNCLQIFCLFLRKKSYITDISTVAFYFKEENIEIGFKTLCFPVNCVIINVHQTVKKNFEQRVAIYTAEITLRRETFELLIN